MVQTNTIGSVAETSNQGAVAGGLPPGPVEDAVLNAENPGHARNLLDQLLRRRPRRAKGALVNDSRLVSDLGDRPPGRHPCAEGRSG